MQRFFIFFVTLLCLTFLIPQSSHASFIDAMGDVPVPQNFEVIEDTLFVFEQENGRVVEVTIAGIKSTGEALDFYGATLPNLGWVQITEQKYIRDNEVLTLSIKKQDNQTTIITLNLSPLG